ncbi:MAG: hypothetical protein H6610_09280 [Ignavibacteriales bacterium]|nr:hypothetical protein [Ignavibacteriales bacterium]
MEKEYSKTLLNNFKSFEDEFKDPSSEFRSVPLWDWNDKITEEGIAFQMEQFKDAGIGGVFVHPRPGLITEYLSEEWFHLFDYTVQKGKELGMNVWIYDENSYPSGFAGGHVPAEMPESYNKGTGLILEKQSSLKIENNDSIAVVLLKTKNGFKDISNSIDKENGKNGDYYIFRKTYPQNSLWYGGFTYVDLLHKGVTEKFIDITMTKGYEKNKLDFGNTLLGIFTDEPNLEAAMARGTHLRWTPDLWDVFQNRWGYDLRINLPSLVEEIGDWKKVRHDYYETLVELFVERWSKPWWEYCENNNLVWTGHYWEHGWPYPTDGMDESAFYIWHQMPGVDMLGNELIEKGQGGQFGNIRAVRELRSAANQAGRTRTLSETYGGGGWDMDFKKFKRLADWQGVFGVNFVNQHLSYYSLKGVRKFDYPPSFSYHEPWWSNYKYMGDYIARLSTAMSAGNQINSTLVLQPNTTAWMYFSRTKNHPRLAEIQHNFKDFVYQLERNHIEYDLGSENVLKTLGSVDRNKLIVGERKYDIIIIPETMENIDESTYKLIEEFMRSGGKVISFRDKILRIDGIESEKFTNLQELYSDQWIFVNDFNDPNWMSHLVSDQFTIIEDNINGELYHQRRILEDGQLVLFVNSDEKKSADAKISAIGKSVIKMNFADGSTSLITGTNENGKQIFNIHLEPIGSALYFISSEKLDAELYKEPNHTWEVVKTINKTEVNPDEENIFVINYLDLSTSKSKMTDTYFMTALTALFQENGIEFGNPWQHKIQYKTNYLDLNKFDEKSAFQVNYNFNISKDSDLTLLSEIKAVVERPELWTVSINGNLVENEKDEYWIDKDFPKYRIGKFLQKGKNTVTINAQKMSIFAEIMPVYILGNFIVEKNNGVMELANGDISKLGSWKENGYDFYSKKVSYTQKYSIEKNESDFKVKLNSWNGTVAEIYVNDVKAGIISCVPQELDVNEFIEEGENIITVKIVGSLKNTFGEFYRKDKSWIYGPHGWNNAPEHQPDYSEYILNDYGLFEPFELLQSN